VPLTAADVLAAERGLVEAPAGCGKTELIVGTVLHHEGRPALVLTHTNAGVYALRERLARAGVAGGRYRLATIDGWALRVVRTYPQRAEYAIDLTTELDYRRIRAAGVRILSAGALDDVLPATYDRLLVDEYQDCSEGQHSLIAALAARLRTCVFGDPLQAVFDFGSDPLVQWHAVLGAYPLLDRLDRPWRWINVDAEDLGDWVLGVRQQLQAGLPIDLTTCPGRVNWQQLSGIPADDHRARTKARNDIRLARNERLLIIGNSAVPGSRHAFARAAPGVGVVEPVDLGDLIAYARRMDGLRGEALLDVVLAFAADVMTSVNATVLRRRIGVLQRGRSRTPATSEEQGALNILTGDGLREAAVFLGQLYESGNCRPFRRRLLTAMIDALGRASTDRAGGLLASVAAVREQRRHSGRRLPRQAIGSTLLLKGLEAQHVLILDADGMDARHLYVALSRGAKSVTVFSRTPVLNPAL
jgi:DNA helicase-2/ATP-dependent DNA helicase PcrA